MKRRLDLIFAALLVPFDYGSLLLAGWLAYSVRFHQVADLLPTLSTVSFGTYFQLLAIVGLAWVVVLAMAGVYRLRQPVSSELGRIFLGGSTAVLMVIVFIFFKREFFASRFIILASWVFAILFMWMVHILVRGLQHALLRRGVGARRVALFGHDATAEAIVRHFRSHPGAGYRVVQAWSDVSMDSLQAFDEMLKSDGIDDVIQADPSLPKAQTLQLLERCSDHNVVFRYAADVFDTHAGNVVFEDVAGVPMIEIRRTPLDGWGRIFKRLLDLLLGIVLVIILCIPGVLVAILIKLDSDGPVFVALERVGQGQRKFTLWKFRSMIRNAHALKPQLQAQNERSDGPLFKIAKDPRITRIGRFIRKTSIDELPQLFNVLAGDMSLIGPRPHEPEEVARYEARHKKLLTVKPGMTGMAQVSGRSNLSFEEEVKLDTYYIEHWSLTLDMAILARTPMAVIRTETAA